MLTFSPIESEVRPERQPHGERKVCPDINVSRWTDYRPRCVQFDETKKQLEANVPGSSHTGTMDWKSFYSGQGDAELEKSREETVRQVFGECLGLQYPPESYGPAPGPKYKYACDMKNCKKTVVNPGGYGME